MSYTAAAARVKVAGCRLLAISESRHEATISASATFSFHLRLRFDFFDFLCRLLRADALVRVAGAVAVAAAAADAVVEAGIER
jgi:hypothetical protein